MGLVNGDPRRMEVLECFASLDGEARQARRGRQGGARRGVAWLGLARRGKAGEARHGMARRGKARLGKARQAGQGEAWRGSAGQG